MFKNISNVWVFVSDFERSVKFFRDTLGLPLKEQHGAYAAEFFKSGTTLGIGLAEDEKTRKMVGRHTCITFRVQNIDEMYRELKAKRVKFSEPLRSESWGKIAIFKDPDGNEFAVMEPRRR